jgi:medium-chain acyl-[acyl-carrier-protein] hydrolase
MQANRWFPFRASSSHARVRLFCFPPAGGGATLFRSWPALLPKDIDVCAVQLPGRESRISEKPVAEINALVVMVASALSAADLELPYAFFGHSLGALVSFETARYLRTLGRPQPMHLFASAASAPHHPDFDRYHLMQDDELIEQLRRDGGYPEEILGHREMMALLLPVTRADAAVTETYRYVAEDPLECAITAIAGDDDRRIKRQELSDWRVHTRGSFREVTCPGGHEFVKTATTELTKIVAKALLEPR